ncbi:hypothetical protein AQUCO_00100438v1 [Aquilegia coerulea]|uniref:Uncharacterized protein n=1 Tax=Aquilegia coerulea TaxID=218851 RepID=A0A2G5FAH4_AQUCA|nr:hypothetical protein AQUCO_00100438v1 [Aquilegia coerulea]
MRKPASMEKLLLISSHIKRCSAHGHEMCSGLRCNIEIQALFKRCCRTRVLFLLVKSCSLVHDEKGPETKSGRNSGYS